MSKKVLIFTLMALLVVTVSLAGCSTETMSPKEKDNPENQELVDSKENPSDDIKDDTEETDENEETNEEKENEQSKEEKNNNIVYISASKLRVRDEGSSDGNILGGITKGSAVKIITEEKNEADGVVWYKVEFDNEENNNEGWIVSTYTVEDRMELLGEGYKELDLAPQNKVDEYPDNPKIDSKGIYVTVHSAANALGRLDKFIELSKETQINTFVIDVKDDYGTMLFPTEAAEKFDTKANQKSTVKDIGALMKKLKENNIYTIARIVSFKDPQYAARYPDKAISYRSNGEVFTNRDGIVWLSPHDRQLWEYNVEVAKEAAKAGFNEIQFDYVRFPASNGGKLDPFLDYKTDLNESKPVTIQRYLKYAYEELSPYNVYVSADIYGQVGSVTDDMGLGQYWEAVSNVVDYVSPMMYPSHYGNGVYGLSVPDAFPYETIAQGIKDGIERNKNLETPAKIKPWIQDFTAPWVKGHIKYGVAEVKAQIKALEDNGVKEYLLWNAGNRYSEGALK